MKVPNTAFEMGVWFYNRQIRTLEPQIVAEIKVPKAEREKDPFRLLNLIEEVSIARIKRRTLIKKIEIRRQEKRLKTFIGG